LDVSRLTALGWQAHTGLKERVASTYQWLDHELANGGRLTWIFPEDEDMKIEHADIEGL
jgi:hypothetical protein